MDKQTRIEQIENLLASGNIDDTQRAVLTKQLATLKGSGASTTTTGGGAMANLNAMFEAQSEFAQPRCSGPR